MRLANGTTLGAYEILALIGSGGMGEVYQAHDTKLGRDVAIKVLPEAFAHDPQRLSRFQREAKLLASLNHPNIATIHGLEESNGTHYLVMELVPGRDASGAGGWGKAAAPFSKPCLSPREKTVGCSWSCSQGVETGTCSTRRRSKAAFSSGVQCFR